MTALARSAAHMGAPAAVVVRMAAALAAVAETYPAAVARVAVPARVAAAGPAALAESPAIRVAVRSIPAGAMAGRIPVAYRAPTPVRGDQFSATRPVRETGDLFSPVPTLSPSTLLATGYLRLRFLARFRTQVRRLPETAILPVAIAHLRTVDWCRPLSALPPSAFPRTA